MNNLKTSDKILQSTNTLEEKFWMIPKGKLEAVCRRKTDNTMSKGQTMIYTTLHIKLQTEHDEPYNSIVVKSRALEGFL